MEVYDSNRKRTWNQVLMATYIFQKLSKEGRAEGLKPGSTEARDWFRDRASSVSNVNTKQLVSQGERTFSNIRSADIGRMYMFSYDPKTKKTLPYYDRFPMIFVVDKMPGGFHGINLHYLPPTYRARLMDALYSVSRKDGARDSEKLQLSYNLLKGASRFNYFKPCFKHYLTGHVRSRLLYIPAEEWDIALMLPTQRFSKKGTNAIWQESRKIIRGSN